MANIPSNDNILEFYTLNSDYAGYRNLENTQEIVDFHNGTTVRIWMNEQTVDFESHWHNALEIIQPIENHYDAVVDEKYIPIFPKEIFIIPPGVLHELKAPDTGRRFIYLFDISPIYGLKGFSSIKTQLNQPLHMTKDSYPLIYDDICQILIQMRHEYLSKTEYGELVIYSLLLNLLVKLGYNRLHSNNLFPNVRFHKQKEYIQKFNELMDYIDEHYTENLNMTEIAERVGFSKYHFSRLFKQYTNFTFCDYITNCRIRAAQELLAKPDFSITEIALQSGFPSISTFNRLFKQQMGCTPSEYRLKNMEAHVFSNGIRG